ncbi:hypothetical protein CIW48_28235 [Methylobacterium sp. P1-11]|uniref:hypothetical protein n=1 Tax=Methylobacterium sp. P1-11 TaxID=2024616 RepID=UPI0011EF5193|nr:hypothetical protein [Methylobacterium sp. P1-11]KAA0115667.1 hypothetical protein CIW48_28235 [Methylobacterium sp. P1-11]
MRYVLVVFSLLAGLVTFAPTEANAVVCARGLYRAGCVGPRGAVGVRRGFYGPRAVGVRRGFYGPRAVGVRRYRRW